MERSILLPLVLAFCACGPHGDATGPADQGPAMPASLPAYQAPDPWAFDVEQHTCALYVALRSHALESSISFGRDLAQVDVHWNMCPGGTMVACATAPAPHGGTVTTGIPWPYGTGTKH